MAKKQSISEVKEVSLKFIGTSPLLLSCDRLADPLDPMTIEHKKLTNITKKTFEDYKELAYSQWNGLMYWDDEMGVYMPTANIRAALVNGATFFKKGMDIKRGTMFFDDKVALNYLPDGKTLKKAQLWEQKYIDRRTVVVSRKRVTCYRPKFPVGWNFEFNLTFDDGILDVDTIIDAAIKAGKYVGIGGYRPEKGGMFGRFDVEVLA
jgi:hypothetical protein